jgi:hypothetical protein
MTIIREHKPIEKRLKKGVYILPNALTLCGMLCGFFSILSSIDGVFVYAAWAIIIANIFDALDGWIARLTNTDSFGIELDLSALVLSRRFCMMYKCRSPFSEAQGCSLFFCRIGVSRCDQVKTGDHI